MNGLWWAGASVVAFIAFCLVVAYERSRMRKVQAKTDLLARDIIEKVLPGASFPPEALKVQVHSDSAAKEKSLPEPVLGEGNTVRELERSLRSTTTRSEAVTISSLAKTSLDSPTNNKGVTNGQGDSERGSEPSSRRKRSVGGGLKAPRGKGDAGKPGQRRPRSPKGDQR